ncbi:MAG TPA: hypothetical protein VHG08_25745 [Longimicrobium sp.]|nr:hypothetical protein [Longimicrobium sp.]
MMTPALRFWGSAALVSIAYAAVVPVLFPYGLIGLDRGADRDRVWLLVVFCTGVMFLLFGLSALVGFRGVGLREVIEAGGARQALERHRAGKTDDGGSYTRNFAWWCVATGALLLVIYFALFAALR